MSPPEDVTDVVLAAEHYYSPAPWSRSLKATTNPYDAALQSSRELKPMIQSTKRIEASPAGRSPKRARWAEDGELATAPRTPYIGRLESPKLDPVECSGAFCDCCTDEDKYHRGRGKMDSQGRWCISPASEV